MATAIEFRPAYVEGGGTVSCLHYAVKSGEDFLAGAPLTINAGEVDEIDTDDVTLVVGVAGAEDASQFGYGASDHPDSRFVTGRANTVPVYVANRSTVFVGQLSNGTTSLVLPDAANVGVGYGIIRQSDGTWTVDEADTTNKVVTVMDFKLQGPECADAFGLVYFKFISSTLAF